MARIYVGNLPIDVKEREIDDLFYKFGRIRDIDLKIPGRPPAFAFVAFEDYRGNFILFVVRNRFLNKMAVANLFFYKLVTHMLS
jgi:hypothetical protein